MFDTGFRLAKAVNLAQDKTPGPGGFFSHLRPKNGHKNGHSFCGAPFIGGGNFGSGAVNEAAILRLIFDSHDFREDRWGDVLWRDVLGINL